MGGHRLGRWGRAAALRHAPASSTAGNAVIDQRVANVWNRLEQRELKRVSRRISGYGPGRLPAPDQPAGTDLLPQIKHIVVLMMENHSYDNYLGMLADRGEGFPLGPDGEPEVSSTGAQGEPVPAHHLDSTVQVAETPSQSWHATHLQWGEGRSDGFVHNRQDIEAGDDARFLCGRPLIVSEVGRTGDHRVGNLDTQPRLRVQLQLLQDQRGNFLRAVFLPKE